MMVIMAGMEQLVTQVPRVLREVMDYQEYLVMMELLGRMVSREAGDHQDWMELLDSKEKEVSQDLLD